ncbi:NAD(P)H-dependent oxidoreductase [Epibacterium sp. SM1979]|uniref:NAD(P)H-dependent oxidoreductase n=1 Tax=Tritonibacter litoralis TaxID=2662264 RepID=A0A843YJU0_9RHOB|nr:NAD(P)H-dependent oxidoreductase [Tritonibacter litoralis]MQQ09915.1 NAD(P)H-dependent oxidoreductase [Tritonibacter litoralis]
MLDHSQKTALQSQILDAYAFRHATKVFDPARKIPEGEFKTILETGRLSPSSFGLEPWQILVVQDPDKRALLEPVAWGANGKISGTDGQLKTASHFVIFLTRTGSTLAAGSEYLSTFLREVKQFPEENAAGLLAAYAEFQAEHFDLTDDRKITDWARHQAYIPLGNMMTTAALLGIDSCPIEGFEMAPLSQILEAEFDVDPTEFQPVVMAAFGYRASAPRYPQTRRSLEQTVRWV